jgi:chromosome segregation ATPase
MTGAKKKRTVTGAARTETGRALVLLEQIQEQNKATIDAVFATTHQLETRLTAKIDQLASRVEVVEIAAREIRSRVEVLEMVLRELVQESKRHSKTLDDHAHRLANIESDLLRIESNLERKTSVAEIMDLDRRLTSLEREVRG